jgi:hypothetical protein
MSAWVVLMVLCLLSGTVWGQTPLPGTGRRGNLTVRIVVRYPESQLMVISLTEFQ